MKIPSIDEILDAAKAFLQSPKGLDLIKKQLGVKTDVTGRDVDVAKRDAIKIKKILRSIRIEVFTVKGRLYDAQTKDNLQGILVSPQLVLYPIVPERDENGDIVYNKQYFATNKEGIVEPLSEKRYNRLLERRDKFDGRQEKNQIIKEGISSTVEYSQDNNNFEENFNSISNVTNPDGSNSKVIQGGEEGGKFFTYTLNTDKDGKISGVYEDGGFNPVLYDQDAVDKFEELNGGKSFQSKDFRFTNFKTTERISYVQDPALKTMSDEEKEKALEIKTDKNGEYEIKFGIPVFGDPDYPKVPLKPVVLYNLGEKANQKYTPFAQQMIKGDHVIKQQLPPLALINIKELSKEQKQKIVDEINRIIDKQLDILLEPVERTIIEVKKTILGFATIAQQKLLPLAIGLLVNFGIAKLAQKNQARCPDNTILKQCIKKRNSIVRQLNNIYGVIIANSALAVAFLILTKNFKIIEKALDKLPIPLQFASYSLVGKLQEIKELLINFSEEFKNLKKSTLISLIILVICLFIILKYLKTIDLLIGDCSDGNIDMEEINAELLILQAQQDIQGETPDKFVNGFELTVVADTENAQNYGEGDLYQRYAIAKDSRGVTILKGEKSFAAEDQILIDELAFYIKQNDLKAN